MAAVRDQFTNATHSAFLATLGISGKVQREVGNLFDVLVKEGEDVEARMKATIDDRIDKLNQAAKTNVGNLWKRLGVASHDDLLELSHDLDELDRHLKRLSQTHHTERKTSPSHKET